MFVQSNSVTDFDPPKPIQPKTENSYAIKFSAEK